MILQRLEAKEFSIWRDQIADLITDSAKINFPGYSIIESYGKRKCDDLYSYLKKGLAVVFIATENNEKLLGWVWCHSIDRLGLERLHISEIAVTQHWRNRGIGKILLEAVESYAHDNGYGSIDLLVTANNIEAVSFYKKASFVEERYLMNKNLE